MIQSILQAIKHLFSRDMSTWTVKREKLRFETPSLCVFRLSSPGKKMFQGNYTFSEKKQKNKENSRPIRFWVHYHRRHISEDARHIASYVDRHTQQSKRKLIYNFISSKVINVVTFNGVILVKREKTSSAKGRELWDEEIISWLFIKFSIFLCLTAPEPLSL